MKNSKNNKAALISGAFGMFLFMIGDWLLDAAGAGDTEIGLIAHSNWPQMAMWRFVLSATLAMIAIFHLSGCLLLLLLLLVATLLRLG